MRPLNILHIAASERWTGAAEPLTSLALAQQNDGHQVWIGPRPGGTFEEVARERGARVVTDFHLNRRMNPLHMLSDLLALPRFCRRNNIDVVHCHLLHDHWLAALSLRVFRPFGKKKPLIFRTRHGSLPPRNDLWHRCLFLKYTDQMITTSRDSAQCAEQKLGLANGSIPHVAGGVNLERFHPGLNGSGIREELNIPLDAPVIGIVARVRAGRGHRWLMSAAPAILQANPNARIVVIGRGELKKWFRQEILKPEYQDRVINGLFRTHDLPQTYAMLDVALFLGLGSEGTCRAILEAMACGKPVVGANVGAVPEIIEDGKTGLIIRNRSREDLIEKTTSLLKNKDLRSEMGKAARTRAEENFSETHRATAFEKIYAKHFQQ